MRPTRFGHLYGHPQGGALKKDGNIGIIYVYNIFSYTYVYLLVLAIISNCSTHSYGSFNIVHEFTFYSTPQRVTQRSEMQYYT
jgi:hypothetical protein